MRNFVKIRKLVIFSTKCLKLGICAQNFGKQVQDLKSSTSEQGTCEIFLRLGKKCPKLDIWAHNFRKQILYLKSAPSK